MRRWTWSFSLLGGLASALACVSLVQRALDVGLTPIGAEALDAYRALIHPIAELLLSWVKWLGAPVSDTLKDLYALSFLGAGAMSRHVYHETRRDPHESNPRLSKTGAVVMTLFVGMSFIGLLAILSAPPIAFVLARHGVRGGLSADELDLNRRFLGGLCAGFFGACAFFLIDSQL